METLKFKAISGKVETKAVPLKFKAISNFDKGENRTKFYVRPKAPPQPLLPEQEPLDTNKGLTPWEAHLDRLAGDKETKGELVVQSLAETLGTVAQGSEFDLSESVKSFLIDLEENRNKMYVPAAKDSKSGATIAKGVDLGQFSEAELKTNIGIDKDLLAKLKPYLGLKKEAADKFVKDNPLSLSDEEVNELNSKIGKYTLKKLERDFKKAVGRDLSGEPRTVQQALLSAYYNLGDNLFEYTKEGKKVTTNFTGELKDRRYKDAAKNLSTWNESALIGLRKRRRLEAELMSGTLKTENAKVRAAEILSSLREG